MLQWCSCLSGVKTYLPALCCRGATVKAVSKPICRHCVAEMQLFKQCSNISARTVLQGCSCLSGVCLHCVAEVQLFKWSGNLSAGTVLHGCSCLSGVETYLPALCCRGAAVLVVSKPICQHCVAGMQLFKWCRNLSASTVLQGCSCLSDVKTYLPALCCSCLSSVETYLPAL